MRKLGLASIAFLTAATVIGSPVFVNAGINSYIKGQTNSKGYVISSGGTNCIEDIQNALKGLEIKNGNCNVVIIPGINNPGSGDQGSNNPDINIPETTTAGNIAPETTTPGNTVPETTTKPNAGERPTGETPTTVPETTTKKENDSSNGSFAEQVVQLVNKERRKQGLKELTLDKSVESAALIRAKEIEVSFSHTRPNGSSFFSVLKENGINYRSAGENIAWGQVSPEAVMQAWMNSDGHRANILNSGFTKIGVGYYRNSSGRNYWTQLFIS